MYGGIEDPGTADTKIAPTSDIYSLKLHASKCLFTIRAPSLPLSFLISFMAAVTAPKFKL